MEYLHRKDKKKTSAREDFEKRLLPKVREYLRKDFGKKKWVFNESLVGSTKRNLVLVGNEGFDMDYQLRFDRIPDKYLKDAKAMKELFRNYLNKAKKELGIALTDCEDSTNVLTMKKIVNTKVDYSYDIAILRLNECGQYVILKNEKQGRQDDYHYVPLPDCGDFNERCKKVKTQEAWALLRDKYKVKKGKYQYTNQDDRPASFSLLGQAVNEVIQKLEL